MLKSRTPLPAPKILFALIWWQSANYQEYESCIKESISSYLQHKEWQLRCHRKKKLRIVGSIFQGSETKFCPIAQPWSISQPVISNSYSKQFCLKPHWRAGERARCCKKWKVRSQKEEIASQIQAEARNPAIRNPKRWGLETESRRYCRSPKTRQHRASAKLEGEESSCGGWGNACDSENHRCVESVMYNFVICMKFRFFFVYCLVSCEIPTQRYWRGGGEVAVPGT